LNRSVFEGMDESLRIQLEGYRPGKYIRIEIQGVPCEIVTNFNPAYPIIVGGIQVKEKSLNFYPSRAKQAE